MSRLLLSLALAALALSVLGLLGSAEPPRPANVAPAVWQAVDGGEATFLVVLREQADLSPAAAIVAQADRGRFVVGRLQGVAIRSQVGLRAWLGQRGIPCRSFYLVNALAVTGGRELVVELAARPEVDRVVANPAVWAGLPVPEHSSAVVLPRAVEWNVQRVNADDVWALGYSGQGVVVAGQDTGYEWAHPALIGSYYGWNGVTATHDYCWHDAIHGDDPNTPAGNPCGFDAAAPCDDNGHGTHTMGTIVGAAGIGVAPGARWIGCRNMEQGWGTPASYIECFEFFLAPYPVGGGPLQGDPARAPQVINNSWVCPPAEGCPSDLLQQAVENVRAAGIMVVVAAGNEGSSCSTVRWPPALYQAAFSVGATGMSDDIAPFSSRGPVTEDLSGRRKPDVSAPGVGVRSSLPGGGYGNMSGTSMAAPHVAGVAALLWSARPEFVGAVEATEQAIERSARPRTSTQGCGGDGAQDVPNNVYGWGIVDALAALEQSQPALEIAKQAAFPPELPARQLVYTIVVTNTSALTLTDVVITDALPTDVPLAWASGSYTVVDGMVAWAPAELAPGARLTVVLAVTVANLPRGSRVVNEHYGARAAERPTPTLGLSVEATVPWRVWLLSVLRGWVGPP